MIELEKLFAELILEIAESLKLQAIQTRGGFCLTNNKMFAGFITFVDRENKLRITMTPRGPTQRPIDLGNYTKEELLGKNSKARKTILTALSKLFIK